VTASVRVYVGPTRTVVVREFQGTLLDQTEVLDGAPSAAQLGEALFDLVQRPFPRPIPQPDVIRDAVFAAARVRSWKALDTKYALVTVGWNEREARLCRWRPAPPRGQVPSSEERGEASPLAMGLRILALAAGEGSGSGRGLE